MGGNALESMSLLCFGLANDSALSPTPPFPRYWPQIRLALLLVPGLFASFFVTNAMFLKVTTFLTGFLFFGQPVLDRGLQWLNREFPHWQKLLEIRKFAIYALPF
jgi:Protein of unknown function (DUF3292)